MRRSLISYLVPCLGSPGWFQPCSAGKSFCLFSGTEFFRNSSSISYPKTEMDTEVEICYCTENILLSSSGYWMRSSDVWMPLCFSLLGNNPVPCRLATGVHPPPFCPAQGQDFWDAGQRDHWGGQALLTPPIGKLLVVSSAVLWGVEGLWSP